MPESEKDPAEVKKTHKYLIASIALGGVIAAVLLVVWAIPVAIRC